MMLYKLSVCIMGWHEEDEGGWELFSFGAKFFIIIPKVLILSADLFCYASNYCVRMVPRSQSAIPGTFGSSKGGCGKRSTMSNAPFGPEVDFNLSNERET